MHAAEIREPHLRRRWVTASTIRLDNVVLRDHLAAWLEARAWDWFGHLTFRACRSDAFAERAVAQWIHRVSKRAWGRNYRKRQGSGAFCYAGFETQKRGDWHAHVLVACVNGLPSLVGKREWDMVDKTTGSVERIGRVYDFEAGRGAAAYCTKYVTKDAHGRGFYRLLGRWRDVVDQPLLPKHQPARRPQRTRR